MADRQEQIAKLNTKLAYLCNQSTEQTRILLQTTDPHVRQGIQENHSNLLLEIDCIKRQLRRLGVNPPLSQQLRHHIIKSWLVYSAH